MYSNSILNLFQLSHHIFIDMKTSCRIKDHQIIAILLGMLNCSLCNIRRFMVVTHGKYFHTLLFPVDL